MCKLRSTLTELTNEVRTLGEDTLDQSPRLTTTRGIPVVARSPEGVVCCVLCLVCSDFADGGDEVPASLLCNLRCRLRAPQCSLSCLMVLSPLARCGAALAVLGMESCQDQVCADLCILTPVCRPLHPLLHWFSNLSQRTDRHISNTVLSRHIFLNFDPSTSRLGCGA